METPILDVMPLPTPRRDDVIRDKIRLWIQTTEITQNALAKLIGKPQPWISRYLKGELDADFDTLETLARVFGHSLNALISAPADPGEAHLIELYRALPEASRVTAIRLFEDWVGLKKGRGRNRK